MAVRSGAYGLRRSRFAKAAAASLLTVAVAAVLSVAAVLGAVSANADPAPGEAWKSSPHHGVTNGATGRPIPCLCRFRDRDFRLGDAVCMQTHLGVMITKCDLQLNNTTWVPTHQPCTLSSGQQPEPALVWTANNRF
jgi:hypothetical protein